MAIEQNFPQFWQWLPQAAATWLAAVAAVALVGCVAGYMVTSFWHGPFAGAAHFERALRGALTDLVLMSPRRVLALAWLAVKESIHRMVLVTFVVFILVILFAGWFLDDKSTNLMELYLSFVMTATSYLVLLLALLLSVFSLPTDLARRTLHTVVTKPVRASEIVVGRILGFVAVGTALLLATGVVSYLFVVRGLNHTHAIVEEDLEQVRSEPGAQNPLVARGKTARSQGHQHDVQMFSDGRGTISSVRGHRHAVRRVKRAGKVSYEVGPPTFPARVPVYGSLAFKDRAGNPSIKGIDVGDEYQARQYIEGGTSAAAIWRFENIPPSLTERNDLRIELTLQVFRSHKGVITRGITGSMVLRNPDNGLTSEDIYFTAREYYADLHIVPRKLLDRDGRRIDVFQDLVSKGRLQVEVVCLDQEQFLGMAATDLYLLAGDTSFAWNFIKGYLGIWLQMVLVTSFGVMFSTFLNGAVAMLATFAALIGGFYTSEILDLGAGRTYGGGPFESFIRLVTQNNVISELAPGMGTDVVLAGDEVLRFLLRVVGAILPDFRSLSNVNYVALGYDIPAIGLAIQTVTALAYVVPLVVLGFVIFRAREVAQ